VEHSIRISESTLNRLRALAVPFEDKGPEDVIRRLLEEQEKPGIKSATSLNTFRRAQDPTTSRVPRQRGVSIELAGRHIDAVSVQDLYSQALRVLVDGHRNKLDRLLPFRTSRQRYLLADRPFHPSGNPFVVPAPHNGYHGYYMESHKDYANAIKHLRYFAKKLGLEMTYLG
jgi:hypothetical protein